MNFGEILVALKEGKKVSRSGWNGKGMFLYYVPAASYKAMTPIAIETFGADSYVPYEPYIAMKNAKNTISIWNPSVMDLFAEDWEVLN